MSFLLALLLACQDTAPPDPAGDPAASAPAAPDIASRPTGTSSPQGTVEAQQISHELVGADRPNRAAVRHILIAYSGNPAASASVTRSQQQARSLAEQLLERIRAGEDFADLARSYSDDPSSVRGGNLGAFNKGAMVEVFEQAAFALDPNFGVSDVVESAFGYHIIQRYPLEEIHVAHVLVQFEGLSRTASDRSREEARAQADQAHARLLAGETAATVAAELSDGPSALRGGDLGWFQRGQMLPQFDQAAFALAPGQVSDVVESPLGFHVIVRLQ